MRGKAVDKAKGVFLGGTRSPRPRCKAGRKPGRVTLTDGLARGSRPKRGDIRFSVMPPLRACGARPSARWPSDGEKAFQGQTRGWRERRFSRRDAVSASALQGRTRAEAFHFHPVMRQEAGWRTGHMPRSSASPPCGRAEPAAPPGEPPGHLRLWA